MNKLFLCVGAAKTGTTWLYKNLDRNPALFFAPEKEINYFFSRHGWFDRLTDKHRQEKCERFEANGNPAGPLFPFKRDWYRDYASGPIGPDWYRKLFEATPSGAWACDFSPSTSLISGEGWREVADFAPEVRIVYIMREPLDRLWSHAKFHAQFVGRLDEFASMSVDEMNEFIEKASLAVDGDYGSHLARIYEVLPRKRVLVIDYAEIGERPYRVLRRVERFLGAPKSDWAPAQKERVNVSAEIPRPEGFGDAYQERFRGEIEKLIALDVDFARDWLPEDDPRRNTWGDRLKRLVGLRR